MDRNQACDILGVTYNATPDQIKKAWRAAAIQWHPDRNKSPNAATYFNKVREAYAALTTDRPTPQPQRSYQDQASHDINAAFGAWYDLQRNPIDPTRVATYAWWRKTCWDRYRMDTDSQFPNIMESEREYRRQAEERKKKEWPLWANVTALVTSVSAAVTLVVCAIAAHFPPLCMLMSPLVWVSIRLACNIQDQTRGLHSTHRA